MSNVHMPPEAEKRLTSPLFTSDLSVNEFAVLQHAGFAPLGLVMGNSVYHIGIQTSSAWQNQELTVITSAMQNARTLAMDRMLEEAHRLSADGIVGLRLEVGLAKWGESLADFMAVGTAVRGSDGQRYKVTRGAQELPFTSALSGQDLWTLRQTGYRPVGLVMGNCVYHVAHQGFLQSLRTLGRNTEMTQFSQALYNAREIAMSRMQAEASRLGASGIVGVQVREDSFSWDSHIIEFFALGTAVVPLEGQSNRLVPQPTLDLGR